VCQGLQFWAFTCNRGANPEFCSVSSFVVLGIHMDLRCEMSSFYCVRVAMLGINMELRCKTCLSSVKVCNFGNSHGT
jgi:hypothetical protein